MMNVREQQGQALMLAVLALAFGMLVITPFLGNAGTSVIGSRVYEQTIQEQYSCDAGIEYAIWGLLSGTLVVSENTTSVIPQFSINSRDVDVTVENLGSGVYSIVAVAASADSHATAVTSNFLLGGGNWTTDGDLSGDTTGDVFVEGDAEVSGGVTVDGDVYVTGNITLGNNSEITGDVVAGGDLDLSNNGVIGGDISVNGTLILGNNSAIGSLEIGGNICAGGDIIIENNAIIYGSIYTTGNLEMNGLAVIKGDVFIGTSIATVILYNVSRIEGNVYITGGITDEIQIANNASIEQNVYATGTINNIVKPQNIAGDVFENYTGSYPAWPGCVTIPESGGSGIVTWD